MKKDVTENLPKDNVIQLPVVVRDGQRLSLSKEPELTYEQAKDLAVKRLLEIQSGVQSVIILAIDKKTGTPDLIMGGCIDPAIVNMFLDIVKDEVKQMFLSATMQHYSDDEFTNG